MGVSISSIEGLRGVVYVILEKEGRGDLRSVG